MKKSLFIFLLMLAIVIALIFGGDLYFFGFLAVYVFIVIFLRAKYIGLNSKKAMLVILSGPFSKNWWRMWQEDNHNKKTGE